LSSRVKVFDLGFTEDDPGVAGRGLVDVGVVDDKEDLLGQHVNLTIRSTACLGEEGNTTYVLWPPEGDPGDAYDMLQPKLGNLLPGPLLIAGVDGNGRPSREITSLNFTGLGLVLRVVFLDLDFLDLVLGNFLNAGVGHSDL